MTRRGQVEQTIDDWEGGEKEGKKGEGEKLFIEKTLSFFFFSVNIQRNDFFSCR